MEPLIVKSRLRAFGSAITAVWRTFRQLLWPRKQVVDKDDWKRWV